MIVNCWVELSRGEASSKPLLRVRLLFMRVHRCRLSQWSCTIPLANTEHGGVPTRCQHPTLPASISPTLPT